MYNSVEEKKLNDILYEYIKVGDQPINIASNLYDTVNSIKYLTDLSNDTILLDEDLEPDETEVGKCYRSLFEYLFPLVVVKTSRDQPIYSDEEYQDMEQFPNNAGKSLPFNKLLYKSYPGTNSNELNIVRPNFDTSYVIGYLNTKYTPVKITVPIIKNIPPEYGGKKRFWGVQMMDGWTNTFASAGTENNDYEGSYVITGPSWRKNNNISNTYTKGILNGLVIILLLLVTWFIITRQNCFNINDTLRNIVTIILIALIFAMLAGGPRKWRKIYNSPTDFVWVIIRIQCQNINDAVENVNKIQRGFRADLLDESFADQIKKDYEEGMIVPTKVFFKDYCDQDADCENMKYCDENICINYNLKNCRSNSDCPDNYYCDTFEPNDGIGMSHECKPINKCECKDKNTGENCIVNEEGSNCKCTGCSSKFPAETCDPKSGRCLKKEGKECLYDWDCETGYCKYNDFGIAEGGLFNRGKGAIATCQQPPCVNDEQCEITGICDFENKVCTTKRKKVKCSKKSDCLLSETCEEGICKHIPVDLNCNTDNDCPNEHPLNLPFGLGKDKRGVKTKKMYCDVNSTPRMCKYKSQTDIRLIDELKSGQKKTMNDIVYGFTPEYFYTLASWILRNNTHQLEDPYKKRELESINMIEKDNAKVGLGGFLWKDLDMKIKTNLIGAFKLGKLTLIKDLISLVTRSTSLTRWINFSSAEVVGTYGSDYSTRAALALQGLGANPAKTAIYLACRQDSSLQKNKLDGSLHNYKMVFDGRVCGVKTIDPPVGSFWSLTVYDDLGFQVNNDANITHVGSETGLKYEEDGTLILTFSTDYNEKYSNWVPIPNSVFNILGRFYLPDEDIISGVWSLPGVDIIPKMNCDNKKWADELTLPSCKDMGHPDGISLKNYFKDGRYPILSNINYIRHKNHQLTDEQRQCMIDPASLIQPTDEDKAKAVANVRTTIKQCLHNLSPEEVTIWDTKGLINPEDKIPSGNNACPINSDTCCATCDKAQPCKKMSKLFNRSVKKGEDGWEFGKYQPDMIATMQLCDKHLPTTPENTIEYKVGKMIANDGWINSSLNTANCEPGIRNNTKNPCVYETKDGNMRGVLMSPSAYYNNAITLSLIGGNDLVGNMPACYNNLSEKDKDICNI